MEKNEQFEQYASIMKLGFGGLEAIDDGIIKRYGRSFKKGDYLIREGEKSKDVYLILSGNVIVTKEVNTINKVLAILGPGEIVGEMSFFEETTRSASCIADDEVVTIVFSPDTFSDIYKAHPRWLIQILESLSKRIVKTLDLLKLKIS